MAEFYHIKIKKEYAAALIDDLIRVEAIEDMDRAASELPQWQKDALDKELLITTNDRSALTPWDAVKKSFK